MRSLPRWPPSPDSRGWSASVLAQRFAVDDTIVAVARPRIADGDDAAVLCAADDLYVDAAPVVRAVRSALLVVDGDQRAVDDPQIAPVGGWWSQELGERLGQTREGPACAIVGDAAERTELVHGEVGPVGENGKEGPVGGR
jgi:hypothetical protein